MGRSRIHPMPHELAPTLTNPQLEGRAVSLKRKFHTIMILMRFSLSTRRNLQAGAASRGEAEGDPSCLKSRGRCGRHFQLGMKMMKK